MKKTAWIFGLCGFAITSLLGTVLHFLYDWLGGALWIAPFSGVNESTWEHMKLLFWPMLLLALAESLFFRGYESFWCVKTKSILLGLCLIPIIFYTYNGVIGKSPDFINILIFFVSLAIAFSYETEVFKRGDTVCKSKRLSLFILFLIGAAFIIFTFNTPRLDIFKDPISQTYGI